MNLGELYRTERGKEAIDKLVTQVKGQLKEGEIIYRDWETDRKSVV